MRLRLFSHDLGIDLGTSNVLIFEDGKGVVIREPSVVAVDKNTGKILQVGTNARNMLGRTPGNVVAMKPLKDGVISDHEMTVQMLQTLFKQINKNSLFNPKPRVVIGQMTAESIKIQIGSVYPRPENISMTVKGRDAKTGLPRELTLLSMEIYEVLRRPARQITDEVLSVLEETSPELVSDISSNGITLTGGGSQIWGMDRLLTERTGIVCTLADDADCCVAYGCGKSLAWINHMTEGPINIAKMRILRK